MSVGYDLLGLILRWLGGGASSGLYRVAAAQAFCTGSAAAQVFCTGSAAGDTYAD